MLAESSTTRTVWLMSAPWSEEGDGSAGGRAALAAPVQRLLLQRGVGAGQALEPLLDVQRRAGGQVLGAGLQPLHVGGDVAHDLVDAVLELQVDDQLRQVVFDQEIGRASCRERV